MLVRLCYWSLRRTLELLAALDELPDNDRAALLNHLDALVTRTRLRTLANTGTG